MCALLLRNNLFLKAAVVVGYFVFQIHPTFSHSLIFDITPFVNNQSGKNWTVQLPSKGSTDELDIQFYFKTNLSLSDFLEKKLETVTNFLDHQTNNYDGLSRRANFILNFRVTKSVFLDLQNITLPKGTKRISAIVITLTLDNFVEAFDTIFYSVHNITSLLTYTNRVGISLDIDLATRLENVLTIFRPNINFFIITKSLAHKDFVPSFELFKSFLKKTSQENVRSIGHLDLEDLQVIHHIQFQPPPGNYLSEDNNLKVFQRYRQFLASTTAQFASEEKENFIIEPFLSPSGDLTVTGGTLLNQTDFIIPKLFLPYRTVSRFRDYLECGRAVFNTLYVWENGGLDCLSSCSKATNVTDKTEKTCCHDKNKLDKDFDFHQTKLNVMLRITNEETLKTDFLTKTNSTNFALVQTIGFNHELSNDKHPEVNAKLQRWKKLNKQNTIFCPIYTEDIDGLINKNNGYDAQFHFNYTQLTTTCEDFKGTDKFIWTFTVRWDTLDKKIFDYQILSKAVFSKLHLINEARLRFIRENPGKQVLYDISTYDSSGGLTLESIYCNERELNKNLFFESIGNWAALQNVNVLLKYIINSNSDPAWMNKAALDGLIERPESLTLLLRNYPSSMTPWFGSLDACVEKTDRIPDSGIILTENFTGATFNFASFQRPPLTVEILKTMLHFVLHKFSRVIIPLGEEVENLKNLITAASQVREDVRESKQTYSKLTQVYIEITGGKSSSAEYYKSVDELVKVFKNDDDILLVGVHVAVEEQNISIGTAINGIREQVKSANTIGIAFNDCTQVLNNILTENTAMTTTALLLKVNYVVCQNHNIPLNQLALYIIPKLLDGNLVTRNTFKKLLPHLTQVHFQLFPRPAPTVDMLRFYSDVSKYSEAYEISYFTPPTFDNPQEKSSGWWSIDNYSDLANTSVYTEKEAEHLGKPTWKPDKDSKISDSSTALLWTIFAAVIILIVMAFGIAYRMGKKSRVLTEDEVREFLQGRKMTEDRMELSSRSDFTAIGFKEEYGIPKVHNALESCPILGMGNFGTVVKTTVRDEAVALKIPNDGVSKESFKSMLIEVKLLCYIGEHVNVVKFVGAYVKEINNGVIQIATVLCENGSLLSFLRGKQSNLATAGDRGKEMESGLFHELIHFAKGIATGMAYIGKKNVVHGDLSARNVLLDGNYTCKIADFGLSRKLYEYNKYVKTSQEPLPWRWMAYESLKRMEFTTMSDMWSYGVTLWEIFSLGDVPYPGLNWTVEFVEEIANGLRMTKPQFSTPEIFIRMSTCWSLEPGSRPKFEGMERLFIEMMNSDYSILNEILD